MLSAHPVRAPVSGNLVLAVRSIRYAPPSPALLAAAALSASAQKYDGPRPPKPDLPFLKHAQNLVPIDIAEAKEEHKKDDILYVIEGAEATARTPLASPIFLIQADKLVPDRLQLFRLTPRSGRREILFQPKKPPKPILMEVTRLTPDRLYKLEVEESLEPGEILAAARGVQPGLLFSSVLRGMSRAGYFAAARFFS